jgi:hypothetical protein
MFKLRPYRSLLVAAFFVLVIGGLLSAYFFMEDACCTEVRRGLFTLILTLILMLQLVIAAFSRYRFSHLRHHRPGYTAG